MRREMTRFVAPPLPPGAGGASQFSVKYGNVGGTYNFASTTACSEHALTGVVFLAYPDGGNNQAASDFVGDVNVEIEADADDICVIFGPSGGGTAGPTYNGGLSGAAAGAVLPSFSAGGAGTIVYNAKGASVPPRRWTLAAGARDARHNSIYIISRTTTAQLRLRVISTTTSAA
jgi:hypothetical protein